MPSKASSGKGQNIAQMNGRKQELLEALEAQARTGAGFSSYENEYERSAFETFLKSEGMQAAQAKVLAERAQGSPALANQIREAMRSGNSAVAKPGREYPDTPPAAAQFQLTVVRNTAAIAEDLPFALFGFQDMQNGYRDIIPSMLAAGTTLTSVVIGELGGGGAAGANRARFTYTNGANVDTVDVTCSTYSYPALLAAGSNDLLKLSAMRMSLSDATLLRQFDLEMRSLKNSPFGKGEFNKLTPSASKSPRQYQNGIVDLDYIFKVDKETTIVGKIANQAAFQVSFNAYVEKFDRRNTAGF